MESIPFIRRYLFIRGRAGRGGDRGKKVTKALLFSRKDGDREFVGGDGGGRGVSVLWVGSAHFLLALAN